MYIAFNYLSGRITNLIIVVLKKGLEFIKKNPPPTILHALSNNETLLNERLGEIKEEIDSLSEELVQEAKAGETAACLEILKLLHRIWKCCQVDKDVGATNVSKPSSPKTETRERAVEKIVEKNVEKKVEKKVVNSMKGPDDNEAYIPSERTFRPMVRWILKQLLKSFKMSNFHPSLALEVESLLNQCSDESKVYIPKNVIEAICQCQIYKFANFFLLQGEGFDFPSSLTTSDKPNPNDASLFLENLIQHKLLNINENMVSSVKDMIVDSTPFYESIHINIISAFMQSQLSETLDLEATVDYLEFVFPTFDRSVTYPYDLEDSLLLWINQCLISLKNQNDQVEGADDDDVELDDLVSTLDDAWMVAQVLQAYYPTETEKTNLKLTKFQKLHDMASRLNLFFVPWLPVDIKHNIGGPEGKSVYSGNSTGLFVCMLREFMVVVQNEKRKFPFVSDDTEDTVQQITQKNKQVTSVVEPKITVASTLPIEAEELSALNEIQTEDIETTEKVVEMVNEENEMAEEVDEENDMNEEVKVENHFIETAHIDQETSLEKDIPREEKSLGLNIEQELLEIIKESESNENRNSSDINSNQEAVDDLNIHEIDKLEVTKQDSDDFVDKLSLSLAVLQTSELPSIDDIRSRRKIPAISTSNRADVSVDEGNNQNLSHRQAQAIPRLNRRTTNRIPIKARERVVLEPLKKIDPFPQKVKESIKIEPDNDPITVNTVFLSPPSTMIEAKKIFDSAIELETAKESTFLSKVNEKHDHQLVIKKEEEIVEEAAAAVEEEELSKNDEKSEMYEQSGHAEIPEGKIILSENALKMLLDDDDEESGEEDAPVFKNEGSVDTDGSDGEIDQETLDMINNIKNIEKKIEAKTSMNALEDEYEMMESSMQIQSQLQYDTLSENSEEPNVPETELDQPLNSNEMDILDFYESEPVTEVPPPKQAPLSRPRTGLQTYPIPENDQDQVETPVFDSQETTASAAAREEEAAAAWERAKRTPKGKTPNEQQTSTQETAPKVF